MFQALSNPAHTVPFSGHVKMIFSDIDFTFLTNAKKISPGVLEASRETIRRNIPLAFATGRTPLGMVNLMHEVGMTAPQVLDNGAEILDPATETYIHQETFSAEALQWLYDNGEKYGVRMLKCCGMAVYADRALPYDEMLNRNNEPITVIPHEDFVKHATGKVAYISMGDDVAKLSHFLEDIPNLPKPAGMEFKGAFTEPGIVVICPSHVSKLSGIQFLCELCHCTVNDVMAIGDGDNDADMLAGVGCAVAMGNATERTKNAANFTVSDNEHDGVAEALRFAWDHQ